MVAASAGVLLARRPGAMSKTTVTALQAMGYGWAIGKWMEMDGNGKFESKCCAVEGLRFVSRDPKNSFPSDRPWPGL